MIGEEEVKTEEKKEAGETCGKEDCGCSVKHFSSKDLSKVVEGLGIGESFAIIVITPEQIASQISKMDFHNVIGAIETFKLGLVRDHQDERKKSALKGLLDALEGKIKEREEIEDGV